MTPLDLRVLAKPFPASDIEWRIGRSGVKDSKPWATALAYVTNRAIMNRLDDVCGPENWCNEFKQGPQGGILCGIAIQVQPDRWVSKYDGAENTDIESVKGGLSDAMKRAAVQWGIGRYLYNLDESFVECSLMKQNGWNFAKSKEGIFYWKTPDLPVWALPKDAAPVDAKTALPKEQAAPVVVPAKPVKPRLVDVLDALKKAESREKLEALFESSKKYGWTDAQAKTISDCFLNCAEKFPAKDIGFDSL